MANFTLAEARSVVGAVQNRASDVDEAVAVAVVDLTGFPVLVELMDGANPPQTEIAMAKAYTAAIMQTPGNLLKDWAECDPDFFKLVSRLGHRPLIAAHGALPLRKDGDLVGGIGIHGATGEEDEAIGISALQDLGYDFEFLPFNRLTR